MMTLIAKDLRQSLWPMLLATVLLLAPPTAWLAFQLGDNQPMPRGVDLQRELTAVFWFGAVASLIASSSIAGVALAKERRERTADMLATLPIAREKVIFSKAFVAMLLTAVPFALGAAVAYLIAPPGITEEVRASVQTTGAGVWVLAAGFAGWLTLFGLAWGLSSLLRSEVLASAVPLLVLIVVTSSIALWTQPRSPGFGEHVRSREALVLPRFVYPLAAIGGLGLVAGTIIALRRKSP